MFFSFFMISLKKIENIVQASSSPEWREIGVPYRAVNNLTVTLNIFTIVEKIGSYQYIITYTLENENMFSIDEGSFKMYYEHSSGGLPQSGFFNTLFPGDIIIRSYTFEELKSDPFNVLEYHHDNFFSSEPLEDSLTWKVEIPDNTPPQILNITQEPKPDEVEYLENVTVQVNVTDDIAGVNEVTLSYSIDDGTEWSNLNAVYNLISGLYETTISGKPLNTTVKYKITAYDNASNYKVDDNNGQYYVYVVLHKASTTISCSISLSELIIDDFITVSGSIFPAVSDVNVTLTYTKPDLSILNRTILSLINGSFSDVYVPSVLGSWNVNASWFGNSTHSGAISSSKSFTVSKLPSAISCSIPSFIYAIGDSMTVSGSLSPAFSDVTITLSYTFPNSSIIERTTSTNSSGGYSDTYSPSEIGSWSVAANWIGDETYEGASSLSTSFDITKIPTIISCSVSSTSLTIGENVTISGTINAPGSTEVTIHVRIDDGPTWGNLTQITTASDGSYSYVWTPTSVALYQLKSSWEGDDMNAGDTSSVISVPVTKISTSLSCTVSSSEITEGASIIITGQLSPSISDTMITVTYQKPDGSTFNKTVITGSDGSYTVSHEPQGIGVWNIITSWNGNETYQEIINDSQFYEVKEPSFFETPIGIATIAGGIVAVISISFILIKRRNTPTWR